MFDAAFDQTEGSLSSTFSASNNSHLQQLTRLETAWAGTVPFTPVAMRVGDAVSDPGTWGNAVRFGGVKLGSLQDLPADIVTAPELTAGRSTLTSSADIVGQNVDRITRFNSASTVTLAVSDMLGRLREVSKPLHTDIAVAPKGKTDYSLSAGRVREDFAFTDGEYGSRFASATVRHGLRRSLTVDAHAAQLDGVVSVMGAGLAKDAGARGKLSAAMATSRSELEHGAAVGKPNGWLARAAYQIANDYFVVALRTRVQSAAYRDLNLDEEPTASPHRRTLASIALRLGPLGDLLLAGAMQTFHDASRADFVSVRHSMSWVSASKHSRLRLLTTLAGMHLLPHRLLSRIPLARIALHAKLPVRSRGTRREQIRFGNHAHNRLLGQRWDVMVARLQENGSNSTTACPRSLRAPASS